MKKIFKKIAKQIKELNKQFASLQKINYNIDTVNNLKKNNFKKEATMKKQDNKIDILDVAQYLIKNQNKNDFSRLKVIKLAYLAYCKYLVDYQKPLFDNDFEAWIYGPVSPKLYRVLVKEPKILSPKKKIIEKFDETKFTNDQKKVLDYILERYGSLTANELVELTHKDYSPWAYSLVLTDWSFNTISDRRICDFYSKPENVI